MSRPTDDTDLNPLPVTLLKLISLTKTAHKTKYTNTFSDFRSRSKNAHRWRKIPRASNKGTLYDV